MSEAAKPKPAATVILLRHGPGDGFEVFLTRRPEGMPFLGGMYCYPGGTVTTEDCSSRVIERSTGLTPKQAQKIVGARYSPLHAIGYWIAAVREVFEEVGVLLAVEKDGAPLTVDDSRANRLAAKHAALLAQSIGFAELLESEKLVCDLASVAHFSHWQTPSTEPIRFATHFFIAPLPAGQTPLATSYEVAHSVWHSPDHAMQLFNRGELPMIFPTFAGLRTLADFTSLEAVMREFGLNRSSA